MTEHTQPESEIVARRDWSAPRLHRPASSNVIEATLGFGSDAEGDDS